MAISPSKVNPPAVAASNSVTQVGTVEQLGTAAFGNIFVFAKRVFWVSIFDPQPLSSRP